MIKDIDKTIEYIEENMGHPLNIESIAKENGYSRFHFHRLFVHEIGTSIGAYIRRRRIVKASYSLINSDESVLNIGLAIGFGHVDTFIRAFKSYYGVTPNHYRTMIRTNTLKAKETTEMHQLVYELKHCNSKDKDQSLVTLNTIIKLAKEAHKEGLLSLEKQLNNGDYTVFQKKALNVLLEGIQAHELKDMLYKYVAATDYTYQELLDYILFIEGILMIQEGLYPWEIRERLYPYFGIAYIENVHFKEGSEPKENPLLHMRITTNNKEFNQVFKHIQQRSMQRLLRECDLILIALVLIGSEDKMIDMIYSTLPENRKIHLWEAYDLIGQANIDRVIDAQNEFIGIYKQLRIDGDVL